MILPKPETISLRYLPAVPIVIDRSLRNKITMALFKTIQSFTRRYGNMKLIMKLFLSLLVCISLCSCSGSSEPKKEAVMLTMTNVAGMTYPEAKKTLEDLGFTNITVKDFDANWDPERYIVSEQNFGEKTTIASNEQIVLTCKKKCWLYLELTSVENWIFSTYDIDVYIDDQHIGTAENGKIIRNLYTANEGVYKLTAYKSGDQSIKGEYTLEFHDDTTFTADMYHTSSSISFKDDQKTAGVDSSIIEEFRKAAEEVKVSDDYASSKAFHEYSIESYTINVPQNWTLHDTGAYVSSDKNAIVYLSVSDNGGWTDEMADAIFKKFTEGKGEDLISSDSLTVSGINMRHAAYRQTNDDGTAMTVNLYEFVDPQSTKGIEINFLQSATSKTDYSKDFEQMLNSIHKAENEEPEETADPEPTPTPTPEPTPTPKPENKKSSLSYTTNDKETAKKGNTGVFAYANTRTYTNYYIIDFDEGYVYFFSEGNGSETCDRIKIDSGDLNSGVTITYHDGSESWEEYYHFKWKNQPDTLVMADSIGWETEYRTTNLEEALKIRDTKKIIDY